MLPAMYKTAIMKTIVTVCLAVSCMLLSTGAHAQQDEPITAEDLIALHDGQGGPFAISPLFIQGAATGFMVKWKTINEKGITSFELETGKDKNNFTSLQTLAAGAAFYQVMVGSQVAQQPKTYFRIKINYAGGTYTYTDVSVIKMRKAG
jgi:hypothetical protein